MKLERRNAYYCKGCKRVTITVDIDEGVTPAFIECVHCKKETASSFMYQIPGCLRFDFDNGIMKPLKADLEWYKPTGKDYNKLSKFAKEHVDQGGLISRPRTLETPIMFEITPHKS